MEIEGQSYYHVYPAMGEVWSKYVEANARQDWKNAYPTLSIGGIVISTTDKSMAQAIAGTETGNAAGASTIPDDEGTYRYQLFCTRVSHFYELLRVIKEFHKGYVLSKLTLADTTNDNAPLPMSHKQTVLANVDKPKVEARSVLIPLLPMNEHYEVVAQRNSEFLAQCLSEGLPWVEADTHLRGVISSEAYQSLRSQFAEAF